MYPYPPVQPDPAAIRSKDESDLNLLSVLHYVWTGFLGCTGLGVLAYFALVGELVASAPHHGSAHGPDVGAIMIIIGVMVVVLMIPMIVLHILAAAGLKKRTRYWLIFVMSCWACTSVPLGTALGIFSILVLQRPSVKALFGV